MNTTITENRRSAARPSFVNVLLGIWVLISPFVLGFARNTSGEWNDIVVGILVALLALAAAGNGAAQGLNVLLGAWLIASPFVLGARLPSQFWNNVILGALIIIFALINFPMRTTTVPEAPHQA